MSEPAIDQIEYSEFPWSDQEIAFDATCIAFGLSEDMIDGMDAEERRYWAGFIETTSRFVNTDAQGETTSLGSEELRDLDVRASASEDRILFVQRLGDFISMERKRMTATDPIVSAPRIFYAHTLQTFTHRERVNRILDELPKQ